MEQAEAGRDSGDRSTANWASKVAVAPNVPNIVLTSNVAAIDLSHAHCCRSLRRMHRASGRFPDDTVAVLNRSNRSEIHANSGVGQVTLFRRVICIHSQLYRDLIYETRDFFASVSLSIFLTPMKECIYLLKNFLFIKKYQYLIFDEKLA